MPYGTDTPGRSWTKDYQSRAAENFTSHARQPIHHPRTSLGAAGHWIHMAGLFAPVVIGELIKDADKRWRYVRLASVGTALAYEALYTVREQNRRKELEAERDHCRENSR
jgi:hypothetical protein